MLNQDISVKYADSTGELLLFSNRTYRTLLHFIQEQSPE